MGEKKKDLHAVTTVLVAVVAIVAIVDVGGAGHHCCHPWHSWPWPSSSSLLVATVNAGSLGLGLLSMLGMEVDVMHVDSTEGKSVSWVCAMGGCSPVMAVIIIIDALQPVIVHISRNFEKFQSPNTLQQQMICR